MERKVQSYNFRRPDRISKNQIRSLHFIHDRFARNFSSSVSAYLRTVVEVTLETIEQVTYSEFLASAEDPTCYSSISLRPLDGSAAVEIGPSLVFPMIDRMLGGTPKAFQRIRPMTEIEQHVIGNVLKLLVDNLKESWRPVYAIEFSVTATETHPQMLQVVSPNEMVVHFKFKARIGQTEARMNLSIPTLVLEPIIHIFDQEWSSRRKITADGLMLLQLGGVPVDVTVETLNSHFPLQSLLSLRAGDTLVLDQRTDWPVAVRVAGKEKLLASATMEEGRRIFNVTDLMRMKEDPRGNVA